MYARIVNLQIIPEKIDAFVEAWHHKMLPAAQAQPGWQSSRLLIDRETGKAMIVGMWTIETAALAASAAGDYGDKQRAVMAGLVSAPPVMEHYEVVGDV